MSPVRTVLFAAPVFACLAAAQVVATAPAGAITVELAKQCRELSIKAFPPARAGTKTGNAGEARNYYRDCVANNGKVPEEKKAKPAPAR